MNVGLMGFGQTGRAVASVLLRSERTSLKWVMRKTGALGHRSVAEFLGVEAAEPGYIYATHEMTAAELLQQQPVDMIVDFSSADGVLYYGEAAAQAGVKIISAISQYPDERLDLLRQLAERTVVLHSPNITLGVNFLLIAAKILRNIVPDVDVEIIEEHFKSKPEVSGTARVIAKTLAVDPAAIKTVRAGGIIGIHEILFGFPYQTVRLKHESISREAFGNGTIFAMQNLPQQSCGLLSMEDLMLPYFNLDASEADFTAIDKKPWWKIWSR